MDPATSFPPASRDPRRRPRFSQELPPVYQTPPRPAAGRPQPTPPVPPPSVPPTQSQSAADQNAASDDFFSGLSNFVQAAVQTENTRLERQRLEQRKDSTEGLLKRAKAVKGFPSTTEFFQHARDNEDVDLSRIDAALKEHQSKYQLLENALKTKWNSMSAGFSAVDKPIQELREGFGKSISGTAQLRNNYEKTKEEHERKLTDIHNKVAMMENNKTLTSTELDTMNQRLEQLSSKLTNLAQHPSNEEGYAEKLKDGLDQLKNEITTLGAQGKQSSAMAETFDESLRAHKKELDQIKSEQLNKLLLRLDKLDTRLRVYESEAESGTLSSAGPRADIASLESRLKTLEASAAKEPRPNNQLTSEVVALKERIDELHSMMNMKDELHFADIDDVTKKWDKRLDDAAEQFRNEINRISGDLTKVSQEKPPGFEERLDHLQKTITADANGLKTVQIAIHSLEQRYNNLSSESVVKNMVVAMQEMYPSLEQLLNSVNLWKHSCDQEFKKFYEHVKVSQESQSELKRLTAAHNSLAQSLTPLWDQLKDMGGLKQSINTMGGDIFKIQTGLRGMEGKIADHARDVDLQLKSKKAADEELKDSLHEERDKLTGLVDNLSKDLAKVATAQETLTRRIDNLSRELTTEVEQLENRHGGMTRKLGDDLQLAIGEVTAVKSKSEAFGQALDSQRAEVKALHDEFTELSEQSATSYQYLRDEFNEVRATAESCKKHFESVQQEFQDVKRAVHSSQEQRQNGEEPMPLEDPAGPQERSPSEESPSEDSRIGELARTKSGREKPLRERVLKELNNPTKKRPRVSNADEEENSESRQNPSSSNSPNPMESPAPSETSSPREPSRKAKKRAAKKQKKNGDSGSPARRTYGL